MENLQEQEQIKLYLKEALEMLDDMRHNLGMFEKQRYYRLKAKVKGDLGFMEQQSAGIYSITTITRPNSEL